jgi:hypothetical protein
MLGHDLVVELTGTPMTLLRVLSGIVSLLGVVALGLSASDEQEAAHDERGVPQ